MGTWRDFFKYWWPNETICPNNFATTYYCDESG